MLCRKPTGIGNGVYVRCGHCVPCRVQKRMLWASRMELEALAHPVTSFVTLTYSDETLPENGSLRPRDVTLWLKRIRKAVEPLRLRYFACGEYGGETWRPHYHAIVYGLEPCRRSPFFTRRVHQLGQCCPSCDLVFKTWGLGIVCAAPASPECFRYVAGYVTKKMASKNDPRLNGRHPEYAIPSRRPGIGVPALPLIKQAMEDGFRLWDQSEDVPSHVLVRGNQKLLLGKYLQRKLREECGRDGETPEEIKRAFYQNMRDVLEFAKENDLLPQEVHTRLGENSASRIEFWERAKPKREKL